MGGVVSAPDRAAEAAGEVRRRRDRIYDPDPEGAQRQRSRGMLLPRERIELLLDPGTEWPFGYTLGRDANLFGFGEIGGRPVAYRTWDPTIRGGAAGWQNRRPSKEHFALIEKGALPQFNLAQSAGGQMNLNSLSSTFAGFAGGMINVRNALPRRGVVLSAILGRAYAPFMATMDDFTVITKDTTMAFVSPLIVQQATGAKATAEEIGGAEVHATVTGQVDRVVDDEPAAIAMLRTVFSYLPGSAYEHAPVVRTGDPADRTSPELTGIVPSYPNKPYDVRAVIDAVADGGSFLEWGPDFGRSMVTGLARFDGQSVVVIANQPKIQAGALTHASMTKARRMLWLASDFGLPLVCFADTPGLFTTMEQEHRGILTMATNYGSDRMRIRSPKVCVVMGKAIGLAYFFMGGSDPEGMTFAWPNAQISYIGPEGGVRVAYRQQLAEADDPRALLDELAEPFRKAMNPWRGAAVAGIDDVIEPAETRPRVIRALRALAHRGDRDRRLRA